MYEEYTQPYVNGYSQMANAIMYPGSANQHLEKVTTTTRKATTPVVVNRDSLISTLAGVNNEYKQALEDANTFWGKLGKSVSDQQVRDALAAPTNKGRLESKMGWGQALSGALLSGLNTYDKFKTAEENKAAKDYEAALKQLTMEDSLMARKEAADLQNALNNQTVIVQGMKKINTGKAGTAGTAGSEMLQNAIALDAMRSDLEDIGTRFDSSFKDIDEMQKESTRFGRWRTDALWGIGRTDNEKQAREDFEAWKGSMKNVLVNANRQAGTGAMSDADAARFEQKIGEAKNPAEARNILDSFQARMMQIPIQDLRNFYSQPKTAEDIDPNTLSADPEVNPERGVNFGGGVRAAAQGLPAVGSYADEAEAYVRSLAGDKSYDEYLKNARESYEGAKRNMPEIAYPLEIGTGIAGEAGLAALTGGASLHPAVQGAMGAVYGYGMGEGDVANRALSAGIMGGASSLLPVAGKYTVKYAKPAVNKGLEYVGKKIANKEMPALMKTLQKDTVMGKAIINTDKQPAIEKAVTQLNALQKTAQTEEQKTVIDNIIRAVNNGEAPDKILRDSGLLLERSDPFAREVSATLLEASTTIPQLNTVRTAINKAESFGEKTAVVNDLLKNTAKKESLYNAVSSDVRDVLNKTWDDQLREGILETARNHNLVGTDMKGLMNRLLVATSNGVDTAIKDTADDSVTTSIRNNIKKALANETELPVAFINELEDRITSEVLARRTVNTLVGKGLESSASGLGLSLIKDAALGIIVDAALPGAGKLGVLIRNVIPGSGSTMSKLAGKASNFAVEKALNKTIKEGVEPALIKALSKNNPNMKNYANKTIKEIAKAGEKTAEYKAIKESLEDKLGEKIVNALKPYKAVSEGIKEASKKPAKQVVKEAIKATPKAAIPIGIREVVKEVDEYEPFTGKQEREKRLNDMLLNNLKRVPNNTTIVLPDNVDSGPSITEKHLRLLAALYPQYYQKVA